jgi:hypothetical protein
MTNNINNEIQESKNNEILLFEKEIKKYEKMAKDKSLVIGLLIVGLEDSEKINKSMVNNSLFNKLQEENNKTKEFIKELFLEIKNIINIINSLLDKFNERYKSNYNKFNSDYKNKNKIIREFKSLNNSVKKNINI